MRRLLAAAAFALLSTAANAEPVKLVCELTGDLTNGGKIREKEQHIIVVSVDLANQSITGDLIEKRGLHHEACP